ncbi:MAG: helicase-exonuclease AddAB subunit AddA [Lachnospiraceae bacterium]|nr:helicase-exonuclease AddAB subunit AddA [Lachnospiraceae bacterium]
MAIEFSEEQKRVIDERGKNILVSAAAGSGKTAVLVERIIRRILSEEAPVDIDRLLVVTFTNAAAASMRQKIRDALEAKYEEEPENENIIRQRTLINMAHITTIHSFCLSVIRDNFNRIGLEPDFRIGDEGELALMKEDALEAVMDRAYEEAEPGFTDFLSAYSLKRDDSDVKEAVLSLYEFSRGKADSREWLSGLADSYETEEGGIDALPLYGELLAAVKSGLTLCAAYLREALKISEGSGGPYFYAPTIEAEVTQLEGICGLEDFEDIREALTSFAFGKLSSKKDESVEQALREEARSYREAAKKETDKLKTRFFMHSWKKERENFGRAHEAVLQLSSLALKFDSEFSERKKEKNIIDFSDIEHYALKIMREGAAEEYRAHFEEIMTDEYQDSNAVQEEILTSIARENNYFCVGDVKQSIYRFRLAEPSIFMARYDSYANDEKSVRIDLKQNFRSRESVLAAVNQVFEPLMSRELGGVDYNGEHRLNPGAVFKDNGSGNECEFYYIEGDPEKELSREETEAYWAAGKIRELVGSFQVNDEGGLRPCRYGDIAILMRALSGRSEVFEKVLTDCGIPVFTASSGGYFQNDVIRKITDLISVTDNPRQDIPLAAVLESPFGGFSDAELAAVRAFKGDGLLIDALRAVEEKGEGVDAKIREKASTILCKLKKYRDLSAYIPIHDLIDLIIRDNDYETYARARGGASEANLKLLLKKAADFEATSYHGLFHFVRYLEKLKKYETEAAPLSEGADCVQLMSIHKSKGLEFPVVLLTGCEKQFNMQDTRGTLIIDSGLGVGIDAIDPERHLKSSTIIKNLIAGKLVNESKGEEMRVFYVAMTRAKEKLIMSGVFDVPEEAHSRRIVSPGLAGSYADYIKYSLEQAVQDGKVLKIEEKEADFEAVVRLATQAAAAREMEAGELAQAAQPQKTDRSLEDYRLKIGFRDDHELINSIPMKAAVTRLKEHFNEAEEGEIRVLTDEEENKDAKRTGRAQAGKQQENRAARRGTAYHKALEMVDITKITDLAAAKEYLNSLAESGRLSREDSGLVDSRDIFSFSRSAVAGRMKRAGDRQELFREQPFIFLCPADEVDKTFPREEQVLIQGIIDAFFLEEGEIVIVDYKTDRVGNAQVLKDRYTGQLELYAKALRQITGIEVKQKLIYSVALHEEIEL